MKTLLRNTCLTAFTGAVCSIKVARSLGWALSLFSASVDVRGPVDQILILASELAVASLWRLGSTWMLKIDWLSWSTYTSCIREEHVPWKAQWWQTKQKFCNHEALFICKNSIWWHPHLCILVWNLARKPSVCQISLSPPPRSRKWVIKPKFWRGKEYCVSETAAYLHVQPRAACRCSYLLVINMYIICKRPNAPSLLDASRCCEWMTSRVSTQCLQGSSDAHMSITDVNI